jgi:hypothetical protein
MGIELSRGHLQLLRLYEHSAVQSGFFLWEGIKDILLLYTGRLERAQWGKKAAMDRLEQLDSNYLEQICWAQIPHFPVAFSGQHSVLCW